jgi:hypothetical protein
MSMQLEDPRVVEFDVRTDEMLVNMGPQHPSTHGVLRIVLRTDGEMVLEAVPHLGYLHRCKEKIAENLAYYQYIGYTDRLDYLARPVALSRDMFLAARRILIHHVRTLPDDRLRTTCNHSEKGKLDGYTWADVAAAHAEHHLGQIEAARSGRPWARRSEYAGTLYGAGVTRGGAPG